jgi:hypothetical protein
MSTCRCIFSIGTPGQRLWSAWIILSVRDQRGGPGCAGSGMRCPDAAACFFFAAPQLLQAVYAICAAISAGNLRTMLVYVNNPLLSRALPLYDESNAFDENARVAEVLAIQLLVADSIGGIIICGIYFLFSGVRGQRSRLCRVSRVC